MTARWGCLESRAGRVKLGECSKELRKEVLLSMEERGTALSLRLVSGGRGEKLIDVSFFISKVDELCVGGGPCVVG